MKVVYKLRDNVRGSKQKDTSIANTIAKNSLDEYRGSKIV